MLRVIITNVAKVYSSFFIDSKYFWVHVSQMSLTDFHVI